VDLGQARAERLAEFQRHPRVAVAQLGLGDPERRHQLAHPLLAHHLLRFVQERTQEQRVDLGTEDLHQPPVVAVHPATSTTVVIPNAPGISAHARMAAAAARTSASAMISGSIASATGPSASAANAAGGTASVLSVSVRPAIARSPCRSKRPGSWRANA